MTFGPPWLLLGATIGAPLAANTTNTETSVTAIHSRAVRYTIGFTALWLGLAVWRDGLTYHLAPILIPLIPAFVFRGAGTDARLPSAAIPIALGGSMAFGGSLALSALDRMNGPSLLPFGDALVESLIFAAVAFLAALIVGRHWLGGRG